MGSTVDHLEEMGGVRPAPVTALPAEGGAVKHHEPGHRPDTSDPRTEAMEPLEIRLPRWPFVLRLFNRAPLVRSIDRVEAFAVALAIVVAVLAVPISAAVGTAVHDSRSHLYAEQNDTRHPVSARVSAVPDSRPLSRTGTITVPVEWWHGNTHRTGRLQTQSTVAAGDSVDLWVDADGAQVLPPTSPSRAVVEAVTAAVGIWLGVAAGAALLSVVVQFGCDCIRSTRWQHDLDSLVDGGGHTTSHP
jgi:hypothetical protein